MNGAISMARRISKNNIDSVIKAKEMIKNRSFIHETSRCIQYDNKTTRQIEYEIESFRDLALKSKLFSSFVGNDDNNL